MLWVKEFDALRQGQGRNFIITTLAIYLLLWPSLVWSGRPGPPSQPRIQIFNKFRVFDATTFKDKPDLSVFGIESTFLVTEGSLFAAGSPRDANVLDKDLKLVLQTAQYLNRSLTIFDVERWSSLTDAVQRYVALMQRLKGLSPTIKAGYYSVVPERDYWRAIKGPGDASYSEWQNENDQLQPVADSVDYLFPSLYTFYDYQPGWVAYAEDNIAEARRLAKGRPVYVFLWFQYHESNPILALQPIPADFWRLQLETVRRLADGVVIWGGVKWDPEAPWWLETLKFLSTLNGNR